MLIKTATKADFEALLPLVVGYYQDSPVPHRVDSIALEETVQRLVAVDNAFGGVLLATQEEQLIGFAFLFLGFDKRALRPIVVLNDLYVVPAYRRQGVARALIEATLTWGREREAVRVSWQTRATNTNAQRLYDQIGERESGWIHYFRNISE